MQRCHVWLGLGTVFLGDNDCLLQMIIRQPDAVQPPPPFQLLLLLRKEKEKLEKDGKGRRGCLFIPWVSSNNSSSNSGTSNSKSLRVARTL